MLAGLQCGWKATPAEGLQPALVRAPRRAPVPAGGAQSDSIPQAVVRAGVRSAALESWRRFWRLLAVVGVILALLAGCSFDPDTAKRKYLENGNKYFARGKYREASIMYRSALKKDRRYGEAYYRLGLAEIRLNRFGEAAHALRRAVELLPSNLDAKVRLGELYVMFLTTAQNTKARQEIASELERLIPGIFKLAPGSFDGWRLQGLLAWKLGDLEKARVHFEEAQRVQPWDPNVVYSLFQVLEQLNRQEEAEKLAWELISRRKEFGPIYEALYNMHLRRRQIDQAEAVCQARVKNNPKSRAAYFALATHYHTFGPKERSNEVLRQYISLESDQAKARLEAVDYCLQVHDYDNALALLREGLAGLQGNARLTYERRVAGILLDRGNTKEAASYIDGLLRQYPNDPELLSYRSGVHLAEGGRQVGEWVRRLERAARAAPDNPVVRFALGRLYLVSGQEQRASAEFKKAMSLGPNYAAPRVAMAQIHLNNKDNAAALLAASEAVRISPLDRSARWLYAYALQGSGRLQEAHGELKVAADQAPSDPDGWIRLGRFEIQIGDLTSAERSFRACLENSGSAQCTSGLAEVLAMRGQANRSIELLQSEIRKAPQDPELRYALAETLRKSGQHARAMALYQELLNAQPNSARIHVRLGVTYEATGDRGRALSCYRKALELEPDNAEALATAAANLTASGKLSEAIPLYKRLVQIQPENPVFLNNLAYLITESGGDLEQALTYAQRANRLMPSQPDFLDTLGFIYLKKNLPGAALGVYRELVGLHSKHPNYPLFRYRHALAAFQVGQFDLAKREAEAALALNPSSREAKQLQELLAQIDRKLRQ